MRKTAIGERIRNTNSHTIVINPENGSEEKSVGSRKPNEKSMLSKGEFSPIQELKQDVLKKAFVGNDESGVSIIEAFQSYSSLSGIRRANDFPSKLNLNQQQSSSQEVSRIVASSCLRSRQVSSLRHQNGNSRRRGQSFKSTNSQARAPSGKSHISPLIIRRQGSVSCL